MTDELRTLGDYELFVYSLTEQFPIIRASTLLLIRRGATLARVTGETESDIKHNRVPAPEMSFTRPNLPVLIRQIEELASNLERAESASKE